ncbi:unnamed protein product [Phytophthora fragariaefolia]|uniref:Unnamed protein product n=1 Tax=Phytophthora fragariaefolia TaxID=1490495 RepID=A0A9W6XVY6_9STRA|nr:unnamed protein product [Phytophthora fragariaefolia]
MVQTAPHALKMYVQDLDQRDWDDYAERLTFAINTAQNRIRRETPFYLVHGWDPRSTLEATILIEAGSSVWLYLDRVLPQASPYVAWPISRCGKGGRVPVRIEVTGTEYRLFQVVHVSKLKMVKNFPDRPRIQLNPDVTHRLDFDEAYYRKTAGSRIWVMTSSKQVIPDTARSRDSKRCDDVQTGDPVPGSNLVSIDRGRDPEQAGSCPRSIYQIKNMGQVLDLEEISQRRQEH